jgi:hypothetical protein
MSSRRDSLGIEPTHAEELRRLEELDGLLKTEEMVLYIDRLKEEVKEIEAFLVECAVPDSDYEVIKQDSEWRTSMKKDMGSSLTKTFRVEGNLKATVPDICAVMSEVDLFPSWVPRWGPIGLQEIKEVVRLTKASAVVYAFLGLPWPLAPRYMNRKGASSSPKLRKFTLSPPSMQCTPLAVRCSRKTTS